MGKDINNVVLEGHLTRDPEAKHLTNGTMCTNIGLAINELFTKNGQKTEYVNYVDIVVWGNTATACGQHLKKGSHIIVQGRIKQERWQDNQTGQTRSKISVVADQVKFLSSPNANNANNANNTQQQAPQQAQNAVNDPWGQSQNEDIPF